MDTPTNTLSHPAVPVLSSQRDARRWIERQLKWEHTLGALRGKAEPAVPERQAA